MTVRKVKITEMPLADAITGNELMEVVQDGENRKVLTSELFKAGQDGADGKSAYQLALDNGFSGTVLEWLNSLKGTQGVMGNSAYQVAVANGFVGTEEEWIISLTGADGKSAYDIWIDVGNVGTKQDFIASLKGEKGDKGDQGEQGIQGPKGDPGDPGTGGGADGKSAYQIWLDLGNTGTEQDFINSLRGADGANGQDGQGFYDIGASLEGKPGAGQEILPSVPLSRFVRFEADFNGSSAKAKVAPTADAVFTIKKDDTEIGIITFAAGNTVGVYTSTGYTSFNIGEFISIVAPAVQDATLSGVGFVLSGQLYYTV